MLIHFARHYRTMLFSAGILAFVCACAVQLPAQEMSDARQTIQAAREANAERYSPSHLSEAEQLMEKATGALEKGDYLRAKEFAVSAQKLAIKARHQAISHQQREPGNF